jgi:hypothetical protein
MTSQTYLFAQLWVIIVLSFVDGLTALVEHPEWFQ